MFNLKKLFFFLSVLLVIHPFLFAEEQLTITTYYPSPAGSYYNLYVAHALGIGTTNPVAADSSAKTLQIGNEYILQNVIGNQVLLSNNAYYDGTWKRAIADYATAIRMYNGEIDFHLAPSGAAGSAIGSNWDGSYRAMTILNTGNVGIGTTSPATLLNVNLGAGDTTVGTAAIRVGGTSNYPSLELGIKGGYGGMISTYGNDLHIYAGNWRSAGATASESHRMYFYTSQASSQDWNTPKMMLDYNGSVGIGTTAPGQKLSIAGGNIFTTNAGGANGFFMGLASDWNSGWGANEVVGTYRPKLFLASNGDVSGTDYAVIDSSGNLGIGTTSPYSTLTVGSSDATAFITPGGQNTHLSLQTVGAGGAIRLYTIGGTTGNVAPTESMRIAAGGNVGIGTTNPGAPLEIVSTGYSSSQVIVKYDSSRFMNIGHSWLKMNAGNYGNDLEFQTDAVGTGGGHRILFEPAGSTAMTILTNGNVGIGTTSPSDRLTVAGNEVPSTDAVFTSGKSGQRWSAVWASNGTIQTCFLAYKNITSWKPFSDYLYLVPKPVQYTWKSGDNREHLGYIGDDLPQIAKVDKDGIEEKAVIAILCGAVRQLEEKVKGLEAEISGLKGKS